MICVCSSLNLTRINKEHNYNEWKNWFSCSYCRGIVWQLLSGAHDSPVKKQFAEYIKATSACERIIRRDIARTYPEHDFFKEKDGLGQESLFNVMKAYSLHDREVGYCQGSGFIVGLLLMQVHFNVWAALEGYKRIIITI